MNLTRLPYVQSLITKPSADLLNLTLLLGIPTEINLLDDHVYILKDIGELLLCSSSLRRDDDEYVRTEVFCEMLVDIKGGMTVLEAFNKQGYTF